MIDTDKYEGHDLARGRVGSDYNIYDRKGNIIFDADDVGSNMATLNLLADAPLLLEFIQKIVKDWCKPNQCNQAFGKDVRQLMYEYGLITFNEETRRYEVKE
jgi:hypothetical protein